MTLAQLYQGLMKLDYPTCVLIDPMEWVELTRFIAPGHIDMEQGLIYLGICQVLPNTQGNRDSGLAVVRA